MLSASGFDLQSLLNGGLNSMGTSGGDGLASAHGSNAMLDASGGGRLAHTGSNTNMQVCLIPHPSSAFSALSRGEFVDLEMRGPSIGRSS